MAHQDYTPRVGDLARLVWGIFGASTPFFASRLGIDVCRTRGGVTIFEFIGDDAQICHDPEALEIEVYILVV